MAVTPMLAAWLLGIVGGLRTMMPLTAVSWAASLGVLDVQGTWLAFLGYTWTPWIMSALALGELVADQLPTTPNRTVPMQFGARVVSGAIAGAAIGGSGGMLGGAIAGIVGAVIGTLGGLALRRRLGKVFGSDPPAAFLEDALAIGGALAIMLAL